MNRVSSREQSTKQKHTAKKKRNIFFSQGEMVLLLVVLLLSEIIAYAYVFPSRYDSGAFGPHATTTKNGKPVPPPAPTLDKAEYDARMLALANRPAPKVITVTSTSSDGTATTSTTTEKINYLWPAKGNPYPNYGAILPFHRVVAYYGNYYSKTMGILGEYPPDVVIEKLMNAVHKWEAADPTTPVVPAIDYIAFTAQPRPEPTNTYNLQMPDSQVDKAIEMANQMNGIVILEIQAGTGDLLHQAHLLEKYLKMPKVMLAIDPEFNMKYGHVPGTYIGTVDATDVNKTAEYLTKLVRENNLPPKILVVHRFTQAMITHAENIKPLPEVQIVIDMDGWGSKAKKINTYDHILYPEPVQFTGFKVFYKNDLKPPSTGLLTPQEIMDLTPIPIFIQYQ